MLEPLLDWYTAHLDGEWEHRYGFTIQTADNPGLIVTLDPGGDLGPDSVLESRSDADGALVWDIRVRANTLVGFCTPGQERALIERLMKRLS